MSPLRVSLGTAFVFAAFAFTAHGQINQQWVTYAKSPTHLSAASNAISDGTSEVDFGVADLNADGWLDVVAVRKQKATSSGKRPNVLLMNESGVLTDRTAQYATLTDVLNDQGFLTPTNDRAVVVADMNGDSRPDVVTATTYSDADPKHISHPRVYRNLGMSGTATWLGLKFEDARIPQFVMGGGQPEAPNFCEVTAGDVDQDGDLDLYFVDYDAFESANEDLNDRFLLNDGNGFFMDDSLNHFTSAQLATGFGLDGDFQDLNGDGKVDLARAQPGSAHCMYNTGTPVGNFKPLALQDFQTGSTYGIGSGDLNGDGKIDFIFSDDGSDAFRINSGNDPFGKVIWSAQGYFKFVSGNDDGFAHNSYIADFDGDGKNDALICDFDVDVDDCSRRMHIYHNRGGPVGGTPDMWEESETAAGGSTTTWKSAVGMYIPDLKGTFDVALGDFDRDGDLDILHARCSTATYWENMKVSPVCQPTQGFAGPGDLTFSMCGQALESGKVASLQIQNGSPSALAFLFAGLASNPSWVPALQGTLVPVPVLLVAPLVLNGDGKLDVTIPGGGGPLDVYAQVVAANASVGAGYEVSNALKISFGP